MDIREFLTAQLAEDQKIAEEASALDTDWPFGVEVESWAEFEAVNAFRQRLGPARVLRDVEADRHLVALALSRQADRDFEYGNDPRPVDRIPELRILASRWSEHPDYQEAWRP